jgi:hypothetical protein
MHLYPEEEYREFVAELREAWGNRESPLLTMQRAHGDRTSGLWNGRANVFPL